MLEIIIGLAIVCFLFWLGFKCTEFMLGVCILLFVKIPIALFLFGLGVILCITILLIPIGKKCFTAGSSVLFG